MRPALAFLFLCLAFCSAAQDSTLRSVLDRYAAKQFSGVALVSKNGRVVWTGATGDADREQKRALRTTTPFRIASVTKTFTAVMILQLHEEGRLKVTDTIGKYLPGYKGPAGSQVTIRQLLTYSSGIADCEGGKGMEVYRRSVPLDTFINRYCSGPLTFAPGSKSSYNNSDYILLGKIIENVTGRSYADNLERRILRPLRLDATGVLNDKKPVAGLARPYTFHDSLAGFVADMPYMTGNYFAAGSLYATAFDLAQFDAGIFQHHLLRENTLKEMIHGDPQLGNVALGFWYSGGWGGIDKPYVYRPGGIGGSRANWIHVLDGDYAIIVLSNTDRGDLFALSQELYQAARKQQP